MGSDESCFNVSLIVSDRHTEFSDGVRIYFSGITPDLLSEDCGFDPWVAGKCSSPEVNFLSWLLLQYLFVPNITAVTGNRPWSFCQKWQWQVATKHIYIHTWSNKVRMDSLVQLGNPSGKQAWTQFIREWSATVLSAHWATVGWSLA